MATLNVADLSPEQCEIWQAEQKYWALVKERDTEGLVALAHDRVTAWPHIAPAPMDSAHFREDARTRGERDSVATYELSFHAIEVHGDAAIVQAVVHHAYLAQAPRCMAARRWHVPVNAGCNPAQPRQDAIIPYSVKSP